MTIPSSLLDELRKAKKVGVLTGAGVSKESGVSTWREAQTGIWSQYRPEDLATPEAFEADPELVWKWYSRLRQLMGKAKPNPGHVALAEMARRFEAFTLITQNIDGLHQQVGSQDVVELHGRLARTKCYPENRVVEDWEDDGSVPPRCPHCKGMLRPDIVWFGEQLPAEAIDRAYEVARHCDVFFSVGTSSLVYPAADLPFQALRRGAVVVEVNPDETPLSGQADFVLRGPSGEVLPQLVEAMDSEG